MTGDYQAPASILPHSFPVVMIDRIAELEEGKKIVCLKNVTSNEEFLQGHIIDNPAMPGMLIIEAMAQASGLIIGAPQAHEVFLAGLGNARFLKAVVPGDQLVIKSSLVREFSPLYVFEASAEVGDAIVAEAEITLTIS